MRYGSLCLHADIEPATRNPTQEKHGELCIHLLQKGNRGTNLTTYSQGAAQPYIKSVAGITFEIIIEEQDNPHANTTQSMTINCSVVHNASKPDFLLGTTFIATKGLIATAEETKDRTRCSTLLRAQRVASDPPHESAEKYLKNGQPQPRLWTHAEFETRHAIQQRKDGSTQNEVEPVGKRPKPNAPTYNTSDSSFEVMYGPQEPVYGPQEPIYGPQEPMYGPQEPMYGPQKTEAHQRPTTVRR